jgi:hypothetical protein
VGVALSEGATKLRREAASLCVCGKIYEQSAT